jgi:hypothetical protein
MYTASDDKEAIDSSNIIKGGKQQRTTRGAKPVSSYREPGDEEGLPENDGTSSVDNQSAERMP